MNSDPTIYWVPSGGAPARYSLFSHYKTGGVDCRIYSSDNYLRILIKWKISPLYGLACNIY